MKLFLLTAFSCAVSVGCSNGSSTSTCDGGCPDAGDASTITDSGGDTGTTQDSGGQDAAKDSSGD